MSYDAVGGLVALAGLLIICMPFLKVINKFFKAAAGILGFAVLALIAIAKFYPGGVLGLLVKILE